MLNKRPIIGLTPQIDIDHPFRSERLFPNYLRSIEKAGGIGLMLPITDDPSIMQQLIDMCDGFVFTGGQDLEPSLYGEEELEGLIQPTGYAPERDRFESAFYPLVKKSKKPILAICRGFQIINVLHGGTIEQELPEESSDPNFVYHPAWTEGAPGHDIYVKNNTMLQKITKRPKLLVNSYHHQGIKKIGQGLTISGISPDGLIEAYDIDGLPFGIGVQWHPEALLDNDLDDSGLFDAFIKASIKEMNKKHISNIMKRGA